MKVVLLTNEYPPQVYGGAGVHVTQLVRSLAALEGGAHGIHVLCFGSQEALDGNVRVQGFDPSFEVPFQDPRHRPFLETLARNVAMTGSVEQADVLHGHTWYACLAGCFLKQILNAPLVLTTHSLEPHRPWKEEQLGGAYRATAWLERVAYENADGVIAVSNAMKRSVQAVYGLPEDRVRVIHNGIDLEAFRPVRDDDVLRAHGIDPTRPFILFVGRITRQKGIEVLLGALPRLEARPQIVLCAGKPDTEALGREVTRRVEAFRASGQGTLVWIPRMLPTRDLSVLYTHAALFVCPSVYEPFGIINLEAMACETPVVATAVGGIPEAVTHGETGLLVPFEPLAAERHEPKDPEGLSAGLADAMNALLADPPRARRMGREGRVRVERLFGWERIARQTLAYYRDLRERHKTAGGAGAADDDRRVRPSTASGET